MDASEYELEDSKRNIVIVVSLTLRSILDFKLSRNRESGLRDFSGEVDFMRWYPVAFLISGVFITTQVGYELPTEDRIGCVLNPRA